MGSQSQGSSILISLSRRNVFYITVFEYYICIKYFLLTSVLPYHPGAIRVNIVSRSETVGGRMSHRKKKTKAVQLVFLDFDKAFDRVSRDVIR